MNHSLGLPPGDDTHATRGPPPVREVVSVCVASPGRSSRSSGWAPTLGLVAMAAIAVFAVQRWATSRVRIQKTSEARAMLRQIQAAEEAHLAEHGVYLACVSEGGLADAQSFFPRPLTKLNEETSDGFRVGDHSSLRDCWSKLGARPSGPMRSSFAVVTGPAGPVVADRPPGVAAENWPFDGRTRSQAPWFLAVAATVYGDGHRSMSYAVSTEADVGEIPIN